jgi:hypothetical protein
MDYLMGTQPSDPAYLALHYLVSAQMEWNYSYGNRGADPLQPSLANPFSQNNPIYQGKTIIYMPWNTGESMHSLAYYFGLVCRGWHSHTKYQGGETQVMATARILSWADGQWMV